MRYQSWAKMLEIKSLNLLTSGTQMLFKIILKQLHNRYQKHSIEITENLSVLKVKDNT